MRRENNDSLLHWDQANRYLTDRSNKNNKARGSKSVIKRKLKFEDYEHCLETTKLENKINQLEINKFDVNSRIIY